MKIGQLAKATGLSIQAIRFYETEGLLRSADRTQGGYRVFEDQDVQRLLFVRKAKAVGLTLKEVREVLALREQEGSPCEHVNGLLTQKLSDVDRRIQELQAFRAVLSGLLTDVAPGEECCPQESQICPIIELLRLEAGRSKGREQQ